MSTWAEAVATVERFIAKEVGFHAPAMQVQAEELLLDFVTDHPFALAVEGVPCTECRGRGQTEDAGAIFHPNPEVVPPVQCSDCGGSGKHSDQISANEKDRA